MELSELGIAEKKVKQFNNVGIESAEDLLALYPKKYIRRDTLTGILPPERESVIIVQPEIVRQVYTKPEYIFAICQVKDTDTKVRVVWFNQNYMYPNIVDTIGKDVLLCGSVTVWGDMLNAASPAVFTTDIPGGLKIYSIYRSIRGMSKDYLAEGIRIAYDTLSPLQEPLPEEYWLPKGLLPQQEAVSQLHWPTSMEALERARERMRWNDLVYFALRVELSYRGAALGSPYGTPILQKTMSVLRSLPFQLTPDQDSCFHDMLKRIQAGQRVNALIQGDVGCGKTILAFLLMIAFAENGYQAALMAPTQILADQHYNALVELANPLGLRVAYAGGVMKKAEQRELQAGLLDGTIQLVVGTQVLLSQGIQFQKLAMVVTDEEHKYGVLQRESLVEKAADGTHVVSMSATPIPRSLAQAVHGNHLQLYSIKTKPPGRKPVQTGMARSMEAVYDYLRKIIANGRQAYVVCPMVSPSEKLEGVLSVEDVAKLYREKLEPHGIQIGVVTGKTKKAEASQILGDFKNNKIHILIATTVIEVGVDVENASAIIIHNAERFGLAQLHQLRGRVGRGSKASICVLISEDKENPRLKAMCETTDGFKIAEMDLRLRGAGDLIGTAQSGTERYLSMALTYPVEYAEAQKTAHELLQAGVICPLVEQAIRDAAEKVGGQMVI